MVDSVGKKCYNGNLLFLDMDGVLNSKEWIQRREKRSMIGLTEREWHHEIDPLLAERLAKFVLDTNCKIVLSSSWRILINYERVSHVIHERCDLFDPASMIGQTHSGGRLRGDEVNDWINRYDFTGDHVILDDDGDFHLDQPLVQTTWQKGLQDDHVAAMKQILKGELLCFRKKKLNI